MCILYSNRSFIPVFSPPELPTDIGRKVFRSSLGISSSPRAHGPGEFGAVVKSLLYANIGDELLYILYVIHFKRQHMLVDASTDSWDFLEVTTWDFGV